MADEGQSCKDQSSAQIVATIDDILKQILLRLPIKSLIRFKSISKNWNSLITDPQFCLLRNPNHNRVAGFFVRYFNEYAPLPSIKSTNPPFKQAEFFNDSDRKTVLHSCNGLLLVQCVDMRASIYEDKYYVYNPTTSQFSKIPKPYDGYWSYSGMSLAFDPAKSPHYKIVSVQSMKFGDNGRPDECQFRVYSSEDRLWRECGKHSLAGNDFRKGVYCNGAIYWRDYYGCFTIDDHILRKLPKLNSAKVQWSYGFWESCDHLHYIIEHTSERHVLFVYEMRRDYSEWFVKYKVDLSRIGAVYPEMDVNDDDDTNHPMYEYEIYSLIRGEKDEDSFLVLEIPGKVVRYNFFCQTSETIHEFAGYKARAFNHSLYKDGIQYIESFSCV